MFGFSTKAVIIGAIVVSLIASFGVYSRWLFSAGASSEQREQIERSLGRNADRSEDDEDIRNLDLDGLCREYGAKRWVPERNGCE